MKSGGEIRIDLRNVHDTDRNRKFEDHELQKGVDGTRATDVGDEEDVIVIKGGQEIKMKWKELKNILSQPNTVRAGRTADTASNFDPAKVHDGLQDKRGGEASKVASDIQFLEDAKASGRLPVTIGTDSLTTKEAIEAKLNAKIDELASMIRDMRAANAARGLAENHKVDSNWEKAAKMSRSDSTKSDDTNRNPGTGRGPRGASLPAAGNPGSSGGAPAGGTPQGAPKAGGFPGAGAFGPEGTPFSPAYLAALDNEGNVAEGLGGLLKSRNEGKKLMMLLLHYIRMAESGDLGAMSQLIRFITWVISKDKARQNIQLSTKLIQLQELSKKALDTLMATPSDSPEKMNEWLKAQHKAKSDESMIATSQKLLADTMQEFAQVVEALMNMNKFMLEAEGRVSRTVTRP